MYSVNKRQKQQLIFFKFLLFVIPCLMILGLIIWLVFFKETYNSANFQQTGVKVAGIKPKTKDFVNELYKISLPTSWTYNGLKNPFSDQLYDEYQNMAKDYENRWIRIYIDVFPADFAIDRLLPVSVSDNAIIPGSVSNDCKTFEGAPFSPRGSNIGADTWEANWQNVSFICNIATSLNYIGATSKEEGYGITLLSQNGQSHEYFFLYIDHNAHPEYTTFTDALKSFETL